MTKRFTLTERKCYFTSLIFDNQENEKMGSDEAMELLNMLHEEVELWKGNCLDAISDNNILQNELDMAIEQGYTPSVPYQNYQKAKNEEIKAIFEYLQIFNEGL